VYFLRFPSLFIQARSGRFSTILFFLTFFLLIEFSSKVCAQQQDASRAAQAQSSTSPQNSTSGPAGREQKPSTPPGFDSAKMLPVYETVVEDWGSLSVGTSHLEPTAPLVAESDEHYGFTRTLVQLKWRPGDPLDLYVIMPSNVKKPPAILYLFGYKEDTDRFKDDRWCLRATSGGFAAVGFVSALTGHRFHDRPMRQWFVSELQESVGSTVHDVKFILDYLAQRGDIDMKHIGMFGQASGGSIALLAAAADPRIRVVDALDPWGDWPVWLKDSWVVKSDPDYQTFVTPEFLGRVAPLDPVKWLPTLKTTKIRIQQVMDNDATPDECKDALKKAAPKQAQIVRWDHAGQLMDASKDGKPYEWIKEQLRALPATPARKTSVVMKASNPNTPQNDSPKAR
jgi:hypothetical protein